MNYSTCELPVLVIDIAVIQYSESGRPLRFGRWERGGVKSAVAYPIGIVTERDPPSVVAGQGRSLQVEWVIVNLAIVLLLIISRADSPRP